MNEQQQADEPAVVTTTTVIETAAEPPKQDNESDLFGLVDLKTLTQVSMSLGLAPPFSTTSTNYMYIIINVHVCLHLGHDCVYCRSFVQFVEVTYVYANFGCFYDSSEF